MEEQQTQELQPQKRNTFKKVLFLFFLLLILFYLYIRCVEPNLLIVHEYPIIDNNLPASFDGTKIVHFSDILYGSTIHEKSLDKIVTKINELKADIVVFTGDILNDTLHLKDEDYNLLKDKLKNIQAKYKKYAVLGDNDYANENAVKEILETAGFTLLNNQNELLYFKGNDPLEFIGTPSLLKGNINLTDSLTSSENTEKTYKIWLSHEPTILDRLYENNLKPNLIFSGHTLNGLFPFPLDGYLLHQSETNGYLKNHYEKEETQMFISSGLGTYKYNIRFLNAPSISLYRLYSHL